MRLETGLFNYQDMLGGRGPGDTLIKMTLGSSMWILNLSGVVCSVIMPLSQCDVSFGGLILGSDYC